MAVTAQFKADFSTFSDAVRKADAQLADFAKGAGNVEKALARMTDNFSGRKLIQDAELMSRAIQDAGGVSTLTARQLQEAGAKADEAADKMRRLGMEVPPELQAISAAASDATRTWDGFVQGFNVKDAIANPVGTAADAIKAFAGTLGPLGTVALAVAGSVIAVGTALYDLTAKAAAVGGQLDDMHQKTGISVPSLSRLSHAAQVAGSDIGTLSDALYKMDIQAADSPEKFAKGLEKLGLHTKEFLALDSEDRLMAFANALNTVEDSATRNAAGAEVMGKQFKDLGPTLMKLNEAMAVTSGISVFTADEARQAEAFEMQTKALKLAFDDLFVTLGRDLLPAALALIEAFKVLGPAVVGAAKNLIPFRGELSALWSTAQYATIAFDQMRGKLQTLPEPTGAATSHLKAFTKAQEERNALPTPYLDEAAEIKRLNAAYEVSYAAAVQSTKAAKELAAALYLEQYQVVGVGAAEQDLALTLQVREDLQRLLTERTAQYYERLTALVPAQKDWWAQLQQSDEVTIQITEHAELMGAALEHIGTKATATFRPVITTAQKVSSVFGDIDSILSNIPGKFAEIGAVAARTGEAIIKNLGNPWAMVIAGAVGAIQVIKQLFGGPSKEELAARDTWAKFAQQFSDVKGRALSLGETIQAIADKLVLAGKTGPDALAMIQVALDATHVSAEAEAAALQHINDVLNDYQADQTRANELIAEYQIGIEKLGPAWRNQQLDEQATSLVNDYRIMLGVLGLSVPDAVELMGDKFNDFLQIALKTGAEIPIGMKPVLEQMAKYGELTDLNGEKITDLSQENITWSMTMSQGFQKVIDKLTEFMDKLFGASSVIEKIGRAAQDLPDNPFKDWQIPPGPSIPDTSPSFAAAGGRVTSSGVQYLASGGLLRMMGRGSDTVPAMLTPGEGVVSRKGMGVLGNAGLAALNRGHGLGGGGGNIFAPVIHVNAQGAHFRTPADRRRLADDVGDAVREIYDRQRRTA